MAINQHASNLINITVKAFNGDVTSISPTDGISLIDSWISFLKSADQSANSLVDGLIELRTELQSGNLDGARIQQILSSLSQQTTQLTSSADSDSKPRLTTLSDALQSFSDQVNGLSGPAATGGQAPMTSTVGGESTSVGSSAGASALGAADDDLSNRTGGIISNDTMTDIDDTPSEDVPEETNQTNSAQGDTGDTYSSVSRSSRSDTSRVEGIGVSGGTGDTETSQSGGRSQY